MHDVEVTNGSVLVLPHETNIAFTHDVPASKRLTGRRISVTVRAFPENFISAGGDDETKARQGRRLIPLKTERRLPAEYRSCTSYPKLSSSSKLPRRSRTQTTKPLASSLYS